LNFIARAFGEGQCRVQVQQPENLVNVG
jgi:hypothetical protein